MTVLIVYATNSSGTEQAAHIVRDVLSAAGHPVEMKRAYHADPGELSNYDLVVLGSCTWDNWVDGKRVEGQLQEHMQQFADQLNGMSFPGRRFAVFALGDSSYSRFCGAADILEELVSAISGAKVGETLRVDGFFFDPERNRQLVADWARSVAKAA